MPICWPKKRCPTASPVHFGHEEHEVEIVRSDAGRTCQTGAMRLTKHHGLGNDFLVAQSDALPADAPALARAVCHRTRGVGADGLIFALPGDLDAGTDVVMVLFNADGSRAEMSGNGIRCLAQAVVQRDERGCGGELRIGTDAGIRIVRIEAGDDLSAIQARVDMGPVGAGPGLEGIDYPGGLRVATADVGNPHLVIQVPDVRDADVATDGAELSRMAGGINVEFISPRPDGNGIDLRVWERGVGVTEACGTGACAAARAAHDWGLVGSLVLVSMPGGDVVVELGDTAVLIGPAVSIATVDYG